MTLHQIVDLYRGNFEAIRSLAANPWSLVVGVLLVLTAAVARHHETRDLRREWWRLLAPFLASTIAALGLSLLVGLVSGTSILELVPALLGLFWLTAPLAWLYGLPYERLASPPIAARVRRAAFALVAALRVALAATFLSVLLGYSWWASLLLVFGFATPAFLLVMSLAIGLLGGEHKPRQADRRAAPMRSTATDVGEAGRRVVDAMGGVMVVPAHDRVWPPPRPPEPEDEESDAALSLGCLSVMTLLAACLLLPQLVGTPILTSGPGFPAGNVPAFDVWAALALALAFWGGCLLRHQPAQCRRTLFSQRLQSDDELDAVLRDLAATPRAELPAGWDPATAVADRRLLAAASQAVHLPVGCWVRSCFLDRFGQELPAWLDSLDIYLHQQDRMTEEQLEELRTVTTILLHVPEGRALVAPYQDYLTELIAHTSERDPARAELLRDLAALSLKRGETRG